MKFEVDHYKERYRQLNKQPNMPAKRKRASSNATKLTTKKSKLDDTEDVSKLTVNKLKLQLKKYSLDQKGKKADLVKRLTDYLASQNTTNDDAKSEQANSSPPPLPKKSSSPERSSPKNSSPKRAVKKGKTKSSSTSKTSPLPLSPPPKQLATTNKSSTPSPKSLTPPSPEKPPPIGEKRESKAARRRRLKKNAKKRKKLLEIAAAAAASTTIRASTSSSSTTSFNPTTEEYVVKSTVDVATAIPQASNNEDMLLHFQNIFQKFALPNENTTKEKQQQRRQQQQQDGNSSEDDMDMDDDEYQPESKALSNRAKKERSRLTVAQLKQLVAHPDVVEDHDVTAADSRLLVHLKSYKGTVPVPKHWKQKRKYLQGKAGHEQSPYQLPASVLATGIDKVREAIKEEEDEKTTKQRQRERTRPKMGKINVDYQALYDAFFVHMKRPSLTSHGDIYYEGKENEFGGGIHGGKSKFVSGSLSNKLKIALGIEEDNSTGAGPLPPPWLLSMQRYGPPPSYPRQKIPGLNAPIPMGAEFGYHPGKFFFHFCFFFFFFFGI